MGYVVQFYSYKLKNSAGFTIIVFVFYRRMQDDAIRHGKSSRDRYSGQISRTKKDHYYETVLPSGNHYENTPI